MLVAFILIDLNKLDFVLILVLWCFHCCRESEGSFYYGNYNHEADDLHSVVQYFSNKNRVVPIILGHSKGGDVVLLYASKYHDVRNVINLSGRYDLKKGIRERLGEDFLERIKQQGFIDVGDGIVISFWFSCDVFD